VQVGVLPEAFNFLLSRYHIPATLGRVMREVIRPLLNTMTFEDYQKSRQREERIKARVDELRCLIDTFYSDLDLMARQIEHERQNRFEFEVGRMVLKPAAVSMELN
jgi:hypothetical protein